jgi:hypothetical protein
MGYLQLNASTTTRTEVCLELVSLKLPASNPSAGLAINFFNLRFTLKERRGKLAAAATGVGTGADAATATSTGSSSSDGSTSSDGSGVESASGLVTIAGIPEGMPADVVLLSSNQRVAEYEQLTPSPAMKEFEQRVRAVAQHSASATAGAAAAADANVSSVITRQQALWRQLQQRYVARGAGCVPEFVQTLQQSGRLQRGLRRRHRVCANCCGSWCLKESCGLQE